MSVSRRDVIKGAGALAGLRVLGPAGFSMSDAAAAVDPATRQRYRLVILYMGGGNDGLNTVVPVSGTKRSVYDCVRSSTNIPAGSLLKLERNADAAHEVGLNPNLKAVHRLYGEDRLAIVQGVEYPTPNYSHFVSNDIWQSGDLSLESRTGWIGRHLERVRTARTELRALFVGNGVPLALRGVTATGMQVSTLPMTFADGTATSAKAAQAAYGTFDDHDPNEPLRRAYGEACGRTYDLVQSTATIVPAKTGITLVDQLLSARELLTNDLGVEVVMVSTGGFDTHDNQATEHATRLTQVDQGIEAFFYGTRAGANITRTVGGLPVPIGPLDPEIAARTILMTFSEFGRRLGDNGSGTDHGAAAPMLMVGPPPVSPYAPAPNSGLPVLVPGIRSEHPEMASSSCGRGYADNLKLTTDLRAVYQAILLNWLHQPLDGAYADPGDPLLKTAGTNVDGDGALTTLFRKA